MPDPQDLLDTIAAKHGLAPLAPTSPAPPASTPVDWNALAAKHGLGDGAPTEPQHKGLLDTIKSMTPRQWAGQGVRLLGGYGASLVSGLGDFVLPYAANIAGAGIGAGTESLAEFTEGSPQNAPAITVAGGVGAIPFGRFFAPIAKRLIPSATGLAERGINAAAGAVRGAALNTSADVAQRFLAGQTPGKDYDLSDLLPTMEIGAAGGGLAGGALHGVTPTPGPETPRLSAGLADVHPEELSQQWQAPDATPTTDVRRGAMGSREQVLGMDPADVVRRQGPGGPQMPPGQPMRLASDPLEFWNPGKWEGIPEPPRPQQPQVRTTPTGPGGRATGPGGVFDPFGGGEPATQQPQVRTTPRSAADVASDFLSGSGGEPPAPWEGIPTPPAPQQPQVRTTPRGAAAGAQAPAGASPEPFEGVQPQTQQPQVRGGRAPARSTAYNPEDGLTVLPTADTPPPAPRSSSDLAHEFLNGPHGPGEMPTAPLPPLRGQMPAEWGKAGGLPADAWPEAQAFPIEKRDGIPRLPEPLDPIGSRSIDDVVSQLMPDAPLGGASLPPSVEPEAWDSQPVAGRKTAADAVNHWLDSQGFGPQVRPQLEAIRTELESFPYEREMSAEVAERGLGRNSLAARDLQDQQQGQGLLGTSAGAPVFHDIMNGRGGSRQSVLNAIERLLGGAKPSKVGQRAIDVAQVRAGLRDPGDYSMSKSWIPTDEDLHASQAQYEAANAARADAPPPPAPLTDALTGRPLREQQDLAQIASRRQVVGPGKTGRVMSLPKSGDVTPAAALDLLPPDLQNGLRALRSKLAPKWQADPNLEHAILPGPDDMAAELLSADSPRDLMGGERKLRQGLDTFLDQTRASKGLGDLAGQADRLSTGEVQPRLPGDAGAVRDVEARQPHVAELPAQSFNLTGGDASEGARAKQPGLLGDEAGGIDPELLYYLGGAGAGAVGGAAAEPDNRTLGAAGGALAGLAAVGGIRHPQQTGAILAKTRASNLFSGAALPKKALSDMGILATTALEHPGSARAIGRELFSPQTRDAFAQGFKGGHSYDPTAFGAGWREPFTSTMSGMTNATQSVLERAGAPVDPDTATFTNRPKSNFGQKVVDLANTTVGRLIDPVAKVPINAVERGLERTPGVGLLPAVRGMEDAAPDLVRRRQILGGLAMLGGGAFGAATSDGGPLGDLPQWAKTLAPFAAGPYMLPVKAAAMAGRGLVSGDGFGKILRDEAVDLFHELPLPKELTLPELLGEYTPFGGASYLQPVPSKDFDTRGTMFGPAAARLPLGLNELFDLPRKTTGSRLRATPVGR